MFGIQHLLFELKALVTQGNPGKIPGRRVTGSASARTLEVLLTRLGVSGLEIGDIYALTSPLFRGRFVLLGMDEGREAGNLLIGIVKAWHALFRAPIPYNEADLVTT